MQSSPVIRLSLPANIQPRTIGTWKNRTAVILNNSNMRTQNIRPFVKLLNVVQCLSRAASSPRPILVSPDFMSTTSKPQRPSSPICNHAQTMHSSPRSIAVARKTCLYYWYEAALFRGVLESFFKTPSFNGLLNLRIRFQPSPLDENSSRRGRNWSENETIAFIGVWTDHYPKLIPGGTRNTPVHNAMALALNQLLSSRVFTGRDVRIKSGNLVTGYRRKKTEQGRTGARGKSIQWY